MKNKFQNGSAALFIAITVMITMIPLALSVVDVNVNLAQTTSRALDSQSAEAAAQAGVADLNRRMATASSQADCDTKSGTPNTTTVFFRVDGGSASGVSTTNLKSMVRNQPYYSFYLSRSTTDPKLPCTFTVTGYYAGIQHAYQAVFTPTVLLGGNGSYQVTGALKAKFFNPTGDQNKDLGDYYFDSSSNYLYTTDSAEGLNSIANGNPVGNPATRVFNLTDPANISIVNNSFKDGSSLIGPVALVDNNTIYQGKDSNLELTHATQTISGTLGSVDLDSWNGSPVNGSFKFTGASSINYNGHEYQFFVGARKKGNNFQDEMLMKSNVQAVASNEIRAIWEFGSKYHDNTPLSPVGVKLATINSKIYAFIAGGKDGLIVVDVTSEITNNHGPEKNNNESKKEPVTISGSNILAGFNAYDSVYVNGDAYVAADNGGIKTVNVFDSNGNVSLSEVAGSAICSGADFKRLAFDGGSTIFAVDTTGTYAGIYKFTIGANKLLARSNGSGCMVNGTTADKVLSDLSQGQLVNDIFYTYGGSTNHGKDGKGFIIGGTTSEELFVVYNASDLSLVNEAPIIGQIFDFANSYKVSALDPLNQNTIYTATTTGVQAVNALGASATNNAKIMGSYLDYGRESNGRALVRKIGVLANDLDPDNKADYIYLVSGKVSDGSLTIKIIPSYQAGHLQDNSAKVYFNKILVDGSTKTISPAPVVVSSNPGIPKDLYLDKNSNRLYILTPTGLLVFGINSYTSLTQLAFLPQAQLGGNTVAAADPYRMVVDGNDIYIANFGAQKIYKATFVPSSNTFNVISRAAYYDVNNLSKVFSPTSIALRDNYVYVGGYLKITVAGVTSYTGYANQYNKSDLGLNTCIGKDPSSCGFSGKEFYALGHDENYLDFVSSGATTTEYNIYQWLTNPLSTIKDFTPVSNLMKMIILDHLKGLYLGGWDLNNVVYGGYEPEPGHFLYFYSAGDTSEKGYMVSRLY